MWKSALLLRGVMAASVLLDTATFSFSLSAACEPCAMYAAGTSWGVIELNSLAEASGIAASRRQPGVIWILNDGSRQSIFAFNRNGERLATFDFSQKVDDTEDIATGPGPVAGVPYLYIGDIGGNQGSDVVRKKVKILRLPEPMVDAAWATNPRSPEFKDLEVFTLTYPDGAYDAETLMIDPVSGDVLIATKQNIGARLYRANLTGLADGANVTLEYVATIEFNQASGGDISPDGSQIVLRREDFAMSWGRCAGATVGEALRLAGQPIPVIGPPLEPNGEGIALLPDKTGYLTISEGKNPVLNFFQSQCPVAPLFAVSPTNQSAFVGGTTTLISLAVGYPPPSYQWYFTGLALARETNSQLILTNLTVGQAGDYQVVASNTSGSVTNVATVTVRSKPDLRITEVMSGQAASPDLPTADWWELTSFELQPVDLSGWRFNDSTGDLTDVFKIPSGLVIHPGESIVFCEDLTPAQFRTWWGVTNIPSTVQVVTYSGSGLSLAASGDGVRLWDAQTTEIADLVASVEFGMATTGASFGYDLTSAQFGVVSISGRNGAIQADLTADIGSPGRLRAVAVAPTLRIASVNEKVAIAFDVLEGFRYSLLTRTALDSSDWELTGDTTQSTANGIYVFEKDVSGPQRFFSILVE